MRARGATTSTSTPPPTSRGATAPTAAPRAPTSPPTAPARRPSRLSDVTVVAARLRGAGCVFAEEEAGLLLAAATGPELETLVVRRLAGEPLEHLLGWVSFAGARYVVTPGVFVPRQRSVLLVEVVVQLIRARPHPDPEHESTGLPPARVLDLCCGTGAIGAAVGARLPDAEVWASDLDPAAGACARQNLDAARVVEGDLFDGLPRGLRFDVVVVNAPYVPTEAIATMPPEARDHEPHPALDGGADGVDVHRRVAAGAGDWLSPGGALVVETSRAQAPLTVAACETAGLAAYVVADHERDATAVVGTAPYA